MPKHNEYRLYVDYEEYRTGGQPLTNERWSDREPEYVEVEFKGVYRSMKSPEAPFFYDSHEVSKETFEASKVYLVVVRYQTGDTFGTSYGNWHLVDILADPEDAKKLALSIEDDTYGKGYKPWQGFFERFEGVEIHQFDVEDEYPGVSINSGNVKFFKH